MIRCLVLATRRRAGPRTRWRSGCARCSAGQAPLVRTLASYRAYYRRWSVAWEAQALLRAEFAAGDPDVGAAFIEMANEIRYPEGGIDQAAIREIRRIKARMEAERMPRGVEPALHLKLGPGGLADVEWVAQLLQLRHAAAVPEL